MTEPSAEIGKFGKGTEGSNSTTYPGQPTDVVVDSKANEVYIADGVHSNHRVIVFDAQTGKYKRHWGAYGKPPVDSGPYGPPVESRPTSAADPLQQFSTPHCVAFSNDGRSFATGGTADLVFRPDGTSRKREGPQQRVLLGHRLVARSTTEARIRRRRKHPHGSDTAARFARDRGDVRPPRPLGRSGSRRPTTWPLIRRATSMLPKP